MVEVGGTGASARHGVPAKTAHQCRFHASTLLRDGSRGLPPLPPSVYDGGSIPSLLHLRASALRGAPAAKANRCLRLIASALLRDGSRGLPPLPSRYGGSIPQTKTSKTSARAEVLDVVTGLLVLIQR